MPATSHSFLRRLPCRALFPAAGIAVAALGLVAATWLLTVERVAYERAEAIQDVETANSNLAIAFEAHTVRTLKGLDQLLAIVGYQFGREGASLNLRSTLQSALDPEMAAGVGIADSEGAVILATHEATGVNVGDRDFFLAHRAQEGLGLYMGRTVPGRLQDNPVIPVARRLSRPDGSFAGVIFVGIKPEYFTKIYGQMKIGGGGAIQLAGLDGFIRARRAGEQMTFGQDFRDSVLMRRAAAAPAGGFLSSGKGDGERRFTSYRVLDDFPLVVSVGKAGDDVRRESRERETAYYIAAFVASLLVVLATGAILLGHQRRRRAQAKLARSEALHRVTFDQAAVGITYNKLDGTYIDANRAYCKMLGYSREELLKTGYTAILYPEDAEKVMDQRARLAAYATSPTISIQLRHVRKDGSVMWAAVDAALVRDEAGAPDFTVAIVQDITERKRAREVLDEQLEELRRFQRVSVDRELRMQEVEEESRRLKAKVAA